MQPVVVKNEEKELQDLLEKNFDLLPGDQIEPDAPCRWMLIKREMPVPDSSTGNDRWAVDFLFVDQNAIPTFVECKRFGDTRSRREVIGQVLEYAANAQHLWSKESIRDHAEATAKDAHTSVGDLLRTLQVDDPDAVDEFFAKIEDNLKHAVVRLVFFLERAPEELKRLVEFLNTQMVSSDVLLVEARQFYRDDLRIVVPHLFGFTEQARQLKKLIPTATPSQWNWERFRDDAIGRKLSNETIAAMESLKKSCESSSSLTLYWGRGRELGSYNIKAPSVYSQSFISMTSDGRLWFNFGNFRSSDNADAAAILRDRLKEFVTGKLGLSVPDDYQRRFPNFPVSTWLPKLNLLEDGISELFAEKAASA
jgi:hypothetical protein